MRMITKFHGNNFVVAVNVCNDNHDNHDSYDKMIEIEALNLNVTLKVKKVSFKDYKRTCSDKRRGKTYLGQKCLTAQSRPLSSNPYAAHLRTRTYQVGLHA